MLREHSKCYRSIQNATGAFKMLPEHSKCYRSIQNATGAFKMLQEHSKCYSSIQKILNAAVAFKMLLEHPNATGSSKCYQSIFIFILAFVTQYKPPCISCLLNDQGDGPILCMMYGFVTGIHHQRLPNKYIFCKGWGGNS